ncbi:exodeoxyribonuclease VII large subunit [Naumannella sp. ID2617S]|nr:exodeoxyribonuclease VII large subunit [Naumannella sp. ID2617S]
MTSSPSEPLPLGRIVAATKQWVERLGEQWVEGQLIELKRRPGAKWHFLTLRDRLAETSATVMIAEDVLRQAGPVAEGMTVVAQLRPFVSSRNASLSFGCRDLRPSGEGRLLAQLEQRKRMLLAEGLFDPALKKRLPFLPRVIGLVTGADSAAERDVQENVRRRWPAARIEVRHALVQGERAAEQVASAVTALDAVAEVEVIVVARGGGSLEDLLAFSDEHLIRAVFAARTPVVSAIGHESDNPLLDLVADVRASTPTDAAKLVVPDVREQYDLIGQARARIERAVESLVRAEQRHLDQYRSRPALQNPLYAFDRELDQLTQQRWRLDRALDQRLVSERTGVQHLRERAGAMSPRRTLERGYAILADGAGDGVTSTREVDEGDDLQVYLADGQLVVEVREVQTNNRSSGREAAEVSDE